MINKIKKWFRVFYIKYILGQCHHLCCLCQYRDECFEQMEYDDMK